MHHCRLERCNRLACVVHRSWRRWTDRVVVALLFEQRLQRRGSTAAGPLSSLDHGCAVPTITITAVVAATTATSAPFTAIPVDRVIGQPLVRLITAQVIVFALHRCQHDRVTWDPGASGQPDDKVGVLVGIDVAAATLGHPLQQGRGSAVLGNVSIARG